MKIEERYKVMFEKISMPIINSSKYQIMNNYMQHGKTTTLEHCINVARLSFWLAIKFNLDVNYENLIYAALLHDYFLYDWHDKKKLLKGEKRHGSSHPYIACRNAKYYFNINDDICDCIKTHMWPYNIKDFPRSTEAKIIVIADKLSAIGEEMRLKKALNY